MHAIIKGHIYNFNTLFLRVIHNKLTKNTGLTIVNLLTEILTNYKINTECGDGNPIFSTDSGAIREF